MNNNILRGVVHGQTIELNGASGLVDGAEVEIRVVEVSQPRISGEGLKRCAGALANDWTEEDDTILQRIYDDRKQSAIRELPE
jgi:hypothetical protein